MMLTQREWWSNDGNKTEMRTRGRDRLALVSSEPDTRRVPDLFQAIVFTHPVWPCHPACHTCEHPISIPQWRAGSLSCNVEKHSEILDGIGLNGLIWEHVPPSPPSLRLKKGAVQGKDAFAPPGKKNPHFLRATTATKKQTPRCAYSDGFSAMLDWFWQHSSGF